MTAYEYRIVVAGRQHDRLLAAINEAGAQGWQLDSLHWDMGQPGDVWVFMVQEYDPKDQKGEKRVPGPGATYPYETGQRMTLGAPEPIAPVAATNPWREPVPEAEMPPRPSLNHATAFTDGSEGIADPASPQFRPGVEVPWRPLAQGAGPAANPPEATPSMATTTGEREVRVTPHRMALQRHAEAVQQSDQAKFEEWRERERGKYPPGFLDRFYQGGAHTIPPEAEPFKPLINSDVWWIGKDEGKPRP